MASPITASSQSWVTITVNGLGGPLCTVKFSSCDPVSKLKAGVEEIARIPTCEQRLFWGTIELTQDLPKPQKDNRTLDLTLVRRTPAQLVWLRKIAERGKALTDAPVEVKSDKDIVICAIRQDWRLIKHASQQLQRDSVIVAVALEEGAPAQSVLTGELVGDKALAACALKRDGLALGHFGSDICSDRDLVLAAVQQCPGALELASESLLADRDLVLCAVRRDGSMIEYADKKLHSDREIVVAAVKQDGISLEYASCELQDDLSLVLQAVSTDGSALCFASDRLRDDPEVVMRAVKQYGLSLKFASERLQGDIEVVKVAVAGDGRALEHASTKLKSNWNLAVAALKRASAGHGYISDQPEDRLNMLDEVFGHIPEALLSDKGFENFAAGQNKTNSGLNRHLMELWLRRQPASSLPPQYVARTPDRIFAAPTNFNGC